MTDHPFDPGPCHTPPGPLTPPQLGDGFAPPPESVACLDDLGDGTTPSEGGFSGLAGEPSPF